MKTMLKQISPLLVTGLICLFFADVIYIKIIGRISFTTPIILLTPDTLKTNLYTDILENWAGY